MNDQAKATCPTCGASFSSFAALESHIRAKHSRGRGGNLITYLLHWLLTAWLG